MINLKNKMRIAFLPFITGAVILASCNKDVQQFAIPATTSNGTISLDSLLRENPNDSLYYKLIRKASFRSKNVINILKGTVSNTSYTLFVPDNAAMIASGFSNAVVLGIDTTSAEGIVNYNMIPQIYDTASIPNVFPNFSVGTSIFLAPFLTLRSYPSKRPGILRVNTIPMTTPLNVRALNGIIHHVAAIVAPPAQASLWTRISTDAAASTGLTFLQAAVRRADSASNVNGTGGPGTLESALRNPAANLTVFAPIDAVFQGTLKALITQFLISQNNTLAEANARATLATSTPGVFDSVAYRGLLSARVVSGILAYHIFTSTAFTVNFPTTAIKYPTLLNTVAGFTAHEGVELQATFSGAFVSTATIKGSINATPASLFINATPAPNGSSDQFYINGVLHKISQVLLPVTP